MIESELKELFSVNKEFFCMFAMRFYRTRRTKRFRGLFEKF